MKFNTLSQMLSYYLLIKKSVVKKNFSEVFKNNLQIQIQNRYY